MCLRFLDHMTEQLNTRFDKYGSMIHKMHAFVPPVIRMGKVERSYKCEDIRHEYRDDPPTLRNTFEEHSRWERQWKAVPKKNQSDFMAKVLKVCDMDAYPNIYVSLKILAKLAETSCECERFGIVLKRLNTYL